MLSLITSHAQIPKSYYPFSVLSSRLAPSMFFAYNPKKRDRQCQKAFILGKYFGLTEVRRALEFGRTLDSSWCCLCAQSEGDVELEAEIMDFMAKSERPTMFPTKVELMRAGRLNLVDAIKKRGGWYSLGWDEDNVGDSADEAMDLEIAEFQRRTESCKEIASSSEHYSCDSCVDDKEDCSENLDSSRLAASASADRSLHIVADEDSGIEGILSRLEKQRNSDLGLNLGKTGYDVQSKSKDEGNGRPFNTSSRFGRTIVEQSDVPGYHQKGMLDSPGGNVRHYTEPETWRTWSSLRAGFQNTEFEAAEIYFDKIRDTDKESYNDGITVTTKEYAKDWDHQKEIHFDEIRTRLQHLESELATALHSLRSKRVDSIPVEISGNPSGLQNLSDESEFQENEFMSAKEKLRSIRSKLAIVEGKMALAIRDAQKIVEVKQKRMNDAHKALQLLRTTCIVWPNSASEVLLAGSFDGWTTQILKVEDFASEKIDIQERLWMQ
ncbi:hypothetical protein ACS0TY_009971 [Phlomoides rotata]